ncbi:hypothetical protein CCP3SC1_110017 [Gammaproteobacteria bacterium]
MPWKARLDELIADGELAAYLESREILDALLAQPVEERWQMILTQDPRLKRMMSADYQSLLKTTATPKFFEVAEGGASPRLGEQWERHSEHLTKLMESSLARLEKNAQTLIETVESSQAQWGAQLRRRLDLLRWPLWLLLLVFSVGLVALVALHSDIGPAPVTPAVQNSQELVKIVESSQARLGELLEQRSQDLAKAMESSQTRWFEQWRQYVNFHPSAWLLLGMLIPGIVWWLVFRSKLSPWLGLGQCSKDLFKAVESSQAELSERLERRSEDLMNALESSRGQMDERLEQVLHEAAQRQERQREMSWRVMAVEELGLKLIEGSDFQAELTALQAMWGESEILAQLEPIAARGVPGRPLLLTTLEHLYGELLIRREEQEATTRPFWNAWLPLFHDDSAVRGRIGKIEERVAHALGEVRRGNWDAAISELIVIEYAPIWRWAETARDRLDLEQWYADLRREVWGSYPGVDSTEKGLSSHVCSKTCRIPFCKPNKLCLKQLLDRFKKVSEQDSFVSEHG